MAGANTTNEFQTVQPPKLPLTQQEVATQAFESAVSPLREQFKERLTGTTEALAQKGIAFGGVGGAGLRDVFKEQQRVEGQIAGSIGSQLGQTALDQAFAASEAAKSRTLQKELQEAGFKFGREEAETQRAFGAEQAKLGRQFAGAESEKERGLRRELTQLGFEEQQKGREFQATQAELGRQFTSEEAERAREFTAEQTQLGRSFEETQAQLTRDFQQEQALLGRTFSAEENALQRQFQEALTQTQLEFQGTQADLARQESRNINAINLALQGNLSGPQVNEILQETFGGPVTLTTNDERDLQRVATAAGLSVDEYTRMRQAIGQGQLADILKVDDQGNFVNIDQYIESPGKARAFEAALATMSINAQREAAGLPPVTQEEVSQRFGFRPQVEGLDGSQFSVDKNISNLRSQLEGLRNQFNLGIKTTDKDFEQRAEENRKLSEQVLSIEREIRELGGTV